MASSGHYECARKFIDTMKMFKTFLAIHSGSEAVDNTGWKLLAIFVLIASLIGPSAPLGVPQS